MILKLIFTGDEKYDADDFGQIFRVIGERPLIGETIVTRDGTKFVVDDVELSPYSGEPQEYVRHTLCTYYLKRKETTVDSSVGMSDSREFKEISNTTGQRPKIFFTFPGIGAKYFEKNNLKKVIIGYANPPSDAGYTYCNYSDCWISRIKEMLYYNNVDYIYAPIHTSLREAIKEDKELDDVEKWIIYPDRTLKLEYIERYRERGDDQAYVTHMAEIWDEAIESIENEDKSKFNLYKLRSSETMSDFIKIYNEELNGEQARETEAEKNENCEN
jgi:hypothetical protein